MISLRSRSSALAEHQRLRFASPGQILIFGLTVLLTLMLMFPGNILQRRLEQTVASDSLTIAYLQAWLRAKPDDDHLRLQLALHLYATGQTGRAWNTLQPLLALTGSRLTLDDSYRAELLQLNLLERLLWTEKPGTMAFLKRQGDFTEQLRRLTRYAAFDERLDYFATRAEAMGEISLARKLYLRLINSDRPRQIGWYVHIAALARAEGNPAMAGRFLLMALPLTHGPVQRQQFFLQALRDLQASNRLDEALQAAALHLGTLVNDPGTLEYLARLALAANRPDLAQHYVALLLQQHVSHPGTPP